MATAPAPANKPLHIALWIVQVLLAVAFGMAGGMKLVTPTEVLAQNMSWASVFPEGTRFLIGAAELAGALGLVLPSALRSQPRLTPAAAAALCTVMAFAATYHISQGEMGSLPPNFVLGGLAFFVLWGRLKKAPIAPRA